MMCTEKCQLQLGRRGTSSLFHWFFTYVIYSFVITWLETLLVHLLGLCNPVVSYNFNFPFSVPSDCLLQPPSAIFHKSDGKVRRGEWSFLIWSFLDHSHNAQSTHRLSPRVPSCKVGLRNLPCHSTEHFSSCSAWAEAGWARNKIIEHFVLNSLSRKYKTFFCVVNIVSYCVMTLHVLMEEASSSKWSKTASSKP